VRQNYTFVRLSVAIAKNGNFAVVGVSEVFTMGSRWERLRWWLGLLLGVGGFIVGMVLPPVEPLVRQVSAQGVGDAVEVARSIQHVLALLWWMLCWWIGEVVPLPVTALLPALVGPLLGLVQPQSDGGVRALPLRAFLQGYADPIVFLFLGSFLLAEALREYGIDRRWGLWLLSRRVVLRSPRYLLLAVMVGGAFLSMWMNNTATAAVLMPVVVGIVFRLQGSASEQGLAAALVLGVAWAASIGGMMTVVGTAPNGIAVAVLRQHGVEVDFLRWLGYGLPAGGILLVVAWRVLVWSFRVPVRFPHAVEEVVGQGREPLSAKGAWRVLGVFLVVVLLWLLAPVVPLLRGVEVWMVALAGAVALFVLPAGEGGKRLVSWEVAQRIDWGTLLLFGGGLSLSGLLVETRAAAVLTQMLAGALAGTSPLLMIGVLLLVANFATELVSNTALAALLLPLVVPLLPQLGIPVEPVAIAVAMVSSCAFMLPVGTPPNAIAYATRCVPLSRMIAVGIRMNLLSTLVLVLLTQL